MTASVAPDPGNSGEYDEVVAMALHELRQVEMSLGAHWDNAEAHRRAVEGVRGVITVMEDYQ